MRILVTGGTGFIGAHVLSELEKNEVLCIVRSREGLTMPAHVRLHEADLQNVESWKTAVTNFKPDACIHLAWKGLPDYSFEMCRRNLDLSLDLISILHGIGLAKFVGIGSCWEYGKLTGQITEGMQPDAPSLFGAVKNAINSIGQSTSNNGEMKFHWGRISFCFGPGQRPTSLIPMVFRTLQQNKIPNIKAPNILQDFIYVTDVARAITAICTEDVESSVFNIGSGVPVRVGAVANMVARECQRSELFDEHGDAGGAWADITRLSSESTWRPLVSITEGVERTIEFLGRQV